MTTKNSVKSLLAGLIMSLLFVGVASAHITVRPGEVPKSSNVTFAISVPSEKDTNTVKIKLDIPSGVTNVTPNVKAGWDIEIEKDKDGVEKSITWSGGTIPKGLRDEFSFSARTPDTVGDLDWKAYQTYTDGSTVSWDQTPSDTATQDSEQLTSGPFSVTKVSDPNQSKTQQNINTADTRSKRALYVAVSALAIAVVALVFTTKQRKQNNK